MKWRDRVTSRMNGLKLIMDWQFRTVARAVVAFICNLIYAIYNLILGFTTHSMLFVASSLFYLLLSAMGFLAVLSGASPAAPSERTTTRIVGFLLIQTSIIFSAVIFFTINEENAAVYGTIPMIAIAAYTFTKITTAVITAVRKKDKHSKRLKLMNTIRYAEIAVSLLTMQQSMLVSFRKGTEGTGEMVLNALTGAGVCGFIIFLGIITILDNRKEQ